jgi:hypothetical protein
MSYACLSHVYTRTAGSAWQDRTAGAVLHEPGDCLALGLVRLATAHVLRVLPTLLRMLRTLAVHTKLYRGWDQLPVFSTDVTILIKHDTCSPSKSQQEGGRWPVCPG